MTIDILLTRYTYVGHAQESVFAACGPVSDFPLSMSIFCRHADELGLCAFSWAWTSQMLLCILCWFTFITSRGSKHTGNTNSDSECANYVEPATAVALQCNTKFPAKSLRQLSEKLQREP